MNNGPTFTSILATSSWVDPMRYDLPRYDAKSNKGSWLVSTYLAYYIM